MRYRVRFNLGRGDNYMKWKVEDTVTKTHEYFDPEEVTILMCDCTLFNRRSTAERIFNGENKTVCAYIKANVVTILDSKIDDGYEVRYNPRVAPYWTDDTCEDIDNTHHKILVTNNRRVYKL